MKKFIVIFVVLSLYLSTITSANTLNTINEIFKSDKQVTVSKNQIKKLLNGITLLSKSISSNNPNRFFTGLKVITDEINTIKYESHTKEFLNSIIVDEKAYNEEMTEKFTIMLIRLISIGNLYKDILNDDSIKDSLNIPMSLLP